MQVITLVIGLYINVTSFSFQILNSFIFYGCKVLDKKNSLLQSKFASALHLILVKQKVGYIDSAIYLKATTSYLILSLLLSLPFYSMKNQNLCFQFSQRILSQDLLAVIMPFLISCLNESPSSLKVSFLQALGAALYANGGNIEMVRI